MARFVTIHFSSLVHNDNTQRMSIFQNFPLCYNIHEYLPLANVDPRTGYSRLQLQTAVSLVQSGEMGITEAARLCGVPRQTVSNRKDGRSSKQVRGRPPTLTQEEEKGMK